MFQEPVDNGINVNRLTDARQLGPQRANPPADEVDLHACLAGLVKSLHHRRFQQPVDLGNDAAALARLLVGGLLLDFFEHECLHPAGSHDQFAPLGQLAITGQVIEKG